MSRSMFVALSISCALASVAPASAGTVRVPQDDPDLQHALTFAANGDTILISKGTYDGPFQAANVDDLTIRGKGKVVLRSAVGDALTVTTAERLTLKNLRLRSDAGHGLYLDTVAGAQIRGVRIDHAAMRGITTNGCSSLHFEKCSVKNVADGILLIGWACLVKKCKLSNADDSLVLMTGGGHVLEDCKLSGATNGVHLGPGLSSMQQALITKNRIRDVEIGVLNGGPANESSIVSNRITRASEAGVRQFSTSPGTLIEKNRVAKCGIGLDLHGDFAIVTRNSVKSAATQGIGLQVGAIENVVHANRVRGAGPHFLLDGTANSLLENDGATLGGANINLNVLSGNFEAGLLLQTVRVPQDFATIQDAIDSGDGLRVVIAGGDYEEVVTITFKQGITLVAKGDGPVRIHSFAFPAVTVTNSENITLAGLRLESANAAALVMTDTRDSNVRDCRISAPDDHAVDINGGSAIRFERCTIVGQLNGAEVDAKACSWIGCDITSGNFGLHLVGNHHLVEGCTVHDTGSNGVQIGQSGAPDTIGVIVRDCGITDSGNKFARFAPSALGNLFADNRCDGSVETGITIDASAWLHVIARNRFDHTTGSAISVLGAPNRFDGNVIRNSGGHGANVDGMVSAVNTWTRNVIVKSANNGFNLEGAGCLLVSNRAAQSGGNSIHDDHPDQNYRTANVFE